jgi:putative transposase
MDNKLEKELYPQRSNLRLPSYDYTWQGAYFVTVCTRGKHCLFGQIVENTMKLSAFGKITLSVWKEIPFHYPEINNDVFVVMPNHVHGIIAIDKVGQPASIIRTSVKGN